MPLRILTQRTVQHATTYPLLLAYSTLGNTLIASGTQARTYVDQLDPSTLTTVTRLEPSPYGADPIALWQHPTNSLIYISTTWPPSTMAIQPHPLSLLAFSPHTSYGIAPSSTAGNITTGILYGGATATASRISRNRLSDCAELTPLTDPSYPPTLRPVATAPTNNFLYAANVLAPPAAIRILLPGPTPFDYLNLDPPTAYITALIIDDTNDRLLAINLAQPPAVIEIDLTTFTQSTTWAPDLDTDYILTATLSKDARNLYLITIGTETNFRVVDTTTKSTTATLSLTTTTTISAAYITQKNNGYPLYASITDYTTGSATIYALTAGYTDYLPVTGTG